MNAIRLGPGNFFASKTLFPPHLPHSDLRKDWSLSFLNAMGI